MPEVTEVGLVCNILNGIKHNENQRHPLYVKAKEIADFLGKKFGKIDRAINIENNFSSLGDMTISNKRGVYILELKKIESGKNGKGTLANVSQNILSELNLVNEAIPWSQWRENRGYQEKILNQLGRWRGYDNAVSNISNNQKKLETEARIIRSKVYEFADKHSLKKGSMASLINKIKNEHLSKLDLEENLAVDIIDQILIIAREDLSSYLNECREKGINIQNLKRLIALLKLGYHTLPLIKKMWQKNIQTILEESNYYIIYYYPNHDDHSKKFKIEGPDDNRKKIKEWSSITSKIDGESLWVTNSKTTILQFKFCWRNVFFGISTPSVEIFDKS